MLLASNGMTNRQYARLLISSSSGYVTSNDVMSEGTGNSLKIRATFIQDKDTVYATLAGTINSIAN